MECDANLNVPQVLYVRLVESLPGYSESPVVVGNLFVVRLCYVSLHCAEVPRVCRGVMHGMVLAAKTQQVRSM